MSQALNQQDRDTEDSVVLRLYDRLHSDLSNLTATIETEGRRSRDELRAAIVDGAKVHSRTFEQIADRLETAATRQDKTTRVMMYGMISMFVVGVVAVASVVGTQIEFSAPGMSVQSSSSGAGVAETAPTE